MQLSAVEWKRNTTSFVYPSFFFDQSRASEANPLISTLKGFAQVAVDLSNFEDLYDYEKVG